MPAPIMWRQAMLKLNLYVLTDGLGNRVEEPLATSLSVCTGRVPLETAVNRMNVAYAVSPVKSYQLIISGNEP